MRAVLRRPAAALVAPAHRPAAGFPQLYVVHRRVFSSETPASISKAIPITDMQKGADAAGGSREADQGKEHSRENPRSFGEASVSEWPVVYFELGKGKLSLLVTMTTTAGALVACPVGLAIPWSTVALASMGTVMAAMSASAFNQIMEVTNDSRMARTARRPLVTGKISHQHAMFVTSATGVAGVAVLAVSANPLTAALAAANIGIYTCIYTPMKQRSIWNTWAGAVVGAIPPMMGWAAVTGDLSAGAWLLGGLLYSWQMPHFLSLAYMMRKDYKDGGYLMMPGEAGSAGLTRASAAAMRHCLYLEAGCLAAPMLGLVSPFFAAEATVLNALFLYLAWQFHQAGGSGNAGKTNTAARRLFLGSLLYLPALLGCMVLHRAVVVKSEHGCPFLDAHKMVAEAPPADAEKGREETGVVAAAGVEN